MNEAFSGKRALVVGMARSGIAAARMLAALGACPVLSDAKARVDGVEQLDGLGCEARLGVPSESLVEGCALVVVSPAVPPDAPVIREAARLSVPVVAELELAARLTKGTQIAITGTNGKTTTCALTAEILKQAGKDACAAGNIGLPLSAVALKTTEDSFTVIEVSSFQLEHMPAFHPCGVAILNLTPDHLNRHGSMEAYGALKEGMLRNQTPDDFYVYNADDAFCAAVAARARAKTVPFSRTRALSKGAWVEDGQIVVNGRALCAAGELSLPGPHNLENALAASAIASMLDVPPPVIRHALRSFQGVEHRMEPVRTVGGVRFINDSKATNPESSIPAINGMREPTVIILGGEDKGMRFDALAEAIRQNPNIRHAVLIGRTARTIQAALDTVGYAAYTHAGTDFEKAVRLARDLAAGCGAVLLSPACASFDMFKDFEARGRAFKEIVAAMR